MCLNNQGNQGVLFRFCFDGKFSVLTSNVDRHEGVSSIGSFFFGTPLGLYQTVSMNQQLC